MSALIAGKDEMHTYLAIAESVHDVLKKGDALVLDIGTSGDAMVTRRPLEDVGLPLVEAIVRGVIND